MLVYLWWCLVEGDTSLCVWWNSWCICVVLVIRWCVSVVSGGRLVYVVSGGRFVYLLCLIEGWCICVVSGERLLWLL